MITMKNNDKTSGSLMLCSNCIHKDICAFSKDYEKFKSEIIEKCNLLEYKHFTANIGCSHYRKEQAVVK